MDSLLGHLFAAAPKAQVFLADVIGTGNSCVICAPSTLAQFVANDIRHSAPLTILVRNDTRPTATMMCRLVPGCADECLASRPGAACTRQDAVCGAASQSLPARGNAYRHLRAVCGALKPLACIGVSADPYHTLRRTRLDGCRGRQKKHSTSMLCATLSSENQSSLSEAGVGPPRARAEKRVC